jgi:hypothetical protein
VSTTSVKLRAATTLSGAAIKAVTPTISAMRTHFLGTR